MKYNLLNESETIQIVRGYNSANKNLCLLETSVVTDGTVTFCIDYPSLPVMGYSIDGYRNPYVDTLAKRDLEFKDATYVIKFLVAKELVCLNGESILVDDIKNIDVFVRELENKDTLNEIDEKIKDFIYNKNLYYSNKNIISAENIKRKK